MTGVKTNLKETILELLVGDWHIDSNYAIQEFNKYIERLEILNAGGTMFDLFGQAKEESKKLRVVEAAGNVKDISSVAEISESSILELSFSGVMQNDDGLCSYGINNLTEQLYNAYGNPSVSGILLNLNSGGGESSSGYTLQQAIADRNKPVVVRSSMLASAALNGAASATEIIAASDASKIGSIGSYVTIDLERMKQYKEKFKDIYSTTSPDKNKDFREALLGNFSSLEKDVTENAKMFQAHIEKYLKLDGATKSSTLSGGMFYAQDAKNRGLVHGVGSKQFAIKRILSHIKYNQI
jgi:protease-4